MPIDIIILINTFDVYQFIRKGEVILSEIHEETESSQTNIKGTKTKERSVHQGHRERIETKIFET